MSGNQAEDDGLTPEERAGRGRRGDGENASIQVYLDAGWYWKDHKLTHPKESALSIRIDPVTRDWYPASKIGKVIDTVIKREGRRGELFQDDIYPTVKMSQLMLKEIECAKRSGEL